MRRAKERMEPLPEGLIAALAAQRGIEHLQTHISHVFLATSRVYKLRKAVTLPFLDFGTRRARNDDCLRELRLNRRLAPDVYLGVAPLVRAGGHWEIGALAETVSDGAEHVVVMRRLPEGRDALSLLTKGELSRAHLLAAAERIATFHRAHALGSPAPFSAADWRERIDRPMRDNVAGLLEHASAAGLEGAAVEALRAAWQRALAACAEALEARRLAGRAVDGHGDLHLAHLWFEAGSDAPLFVDCVEFDDGLRCIDAASDVAFLAMDLAYRGHEALAEAWLARYAEAAGDFDLYAVVDLYAAYRAAVRAKVAALAAADPEILDAQRAAAAGSAARHLALASRLLAPRDSGRLVLVGGSVGTGKSSVAAALAEAGPAVVLSSDRTRKALAGLPPRARVSAPPDAGLYSAEWTGRTYATLLERAAPILRSGRSVVLDATWSTRRHRDEARALAQRLGARALFVRVDCSEATARERVRRRAEHDDDPSDAGPERVAPSRRHFEAPDEWPREALVELSTDSPAWRERLSEWVR